MVTNKPLLAIVAVDWRPPNVTLGVAAYDDVNDAEPARVAAAEIDPENPPKGLVDYIKQFSAVFVPDYRHGYDRVFRKVPTKAFAVASLVEAREYLSDADAESWPVQLGVYEASGIKGAQAYAKAFGHVAKKSYERMLMSAKAMKHLAPNVNVDIAQPVAKIGEDFFDVFRETKAEATPVGELKSHFAQTLGNHESGLVKYAEAFEDGDFESDTHTLDNDQVLRIRKAGLIVGANPGKYPSPGKTLVEFDFSRMYPSVVSHFGALPKGHGAKWLNMYRKAVALGKQLKPVSKPGSEFLKLATNAYIGKQESLDPVWFRWVTMYSQVYMADLLDGLVNRFPTAINIVVCSTDGVIMEVDPDIAQDIRDDVDDATTKVFGENMAVDHDHPDGILVRDNSTYYKWEGKTYWESTDRGEGFGVGKGALRADKGAADTSHRPRPGVVLKMVLGEIIAGIPFDQTVRACKHPRDFLIPVFATKSGPMYLGPKPSKFNAVQRQATWVLPVTGSKDFLWNGSTKRLTNKLTKNHQPIVEVRSQRDYDRAAIRKDFTYYKGEAKALRDAILPEVNAKLFF